MGGQKPEGMTDAQWAAKLGEQGYSRKEYKSISNQGNKDAFWTGDGFGWGELENTSDAYDPNKTY